jgi:hypothetical protein
MPPTAEELRSRESLLRSTLLETGDKLRDIRSKPDDDRAKFEAEAADCVRQINRLDAELKAVLLSIAPPQNGSGPSAGTRNFQVPDLRSFGERIVESEDFLEWQAHGRRGPLVIEGRGNLGDTRAVRGEFRANNLIDEANTDSTSAFQWLPLGTPYLNPAAVDRIRLFVQDLCAQGNTTLASVPYIRELNPRTTELGVSSVAEGASKPEVSNTFVRADAPVRKMAGWLPITEEILADAPTLRSYLDERLRYMVALREELEILKGNGVAPDLTGILNTAGIQTQSATSGDPATTIANAIAKIQLVDGDADGVAMNPSDWWTMVTHRSSGSGQFDVLQAWQQGQPYTVWGLKVVTTRNQTAGHATVGGWRLGAQILRRQEYTLRIGDQHSDYFVKNLLVMLGESRLALAVHRPDFFVDATL